MQKDNRIWKELCGENTHIFRELLNNCLHVVSEFGSQCYSDLAESFTNGSCISSIRYTGTP
jgi:hypothetical protein